MDSPPLLDPVLESEILPDLSVESGVSADSLPPFVSASPTPLVIRASPIDNPHNDQIAECDIQTEQPVSESVSSLPEKAHEPSAPQQELPVVPPATVQNTSPLANTPYGRWLLGHPDILAPLLSDGSVRQEVQQSIAQVNCPTETCPAPPTTNQSPTPKISTTRQYSPRQPQRLFRRR